jgi:hypothetical protein
MQDLIWLLLKPENRFLAFCAPDAMGQGTLQLKPGTARLGFWSSVVVLSSGVILLCGIVASSILLPPALTTEWSGIGPYAEAYRATDGVITSLSFLAALVLCPAYVFQILGINRAHRPTLGGSGKLGLMSAVAFSVLSGLNYFVQLTIVRYDILSSRTTGIDWLIFQNPSSLMLGLDFVGWFFLGLAFLSVASQFRATTLDKTIRYLLIINAIVGTIELGSLFASFPTLGQVLLSATSILLMCVDVLLLVHFSRLLRPATRSQIPDS